MTHKLRDGKRGTSPYLLREMNIHVPWNDILNTSFEWPCDFKGIRHNYLRDQLSQEFKRHCTLN